MIISKNMFKNADISLFITVVLICVIGITSIAGATQVFQGGTTRYFKFQIMWFFIGILLLTSAALLVDYGTLRHYYRQIYFVNMGLLLTVVAIGRVSHGANSWLNIGIFGIQPSEFMCISLIIVFAKKIEDFEGNINNIKNLVILFFYAVPPMLLIAIQPNLGMTLVLLAIVVGMLFMGGLNLKLFLGGIAAAVMSALGVWFSPIQILKSYQKDRILIFLEPEKDALGAGYHLAQSKMAIGSGEMFGMGMGHGAITDGKFLPEAHTDFIFSVLGEDFGFIGTILLVGLYSFFIMRCIKIARTAKDKFGEMIAVGVISMMLFHIFENIGMTVGLMPVAGITLPFMSYGGSSMLTNMVAVGLVLNVGIRRHKINFSSLRNVTIF